jgi:GTPase SAR1 family protein
MSDKSKNCKVVVLGESGVGKTCLITRYVSDTYTETTCSTNGATYASKTVDIDDIHYFPVHITEFFRK